MSMSPNISVLMALSSSFTWGVVQIFAEGWQLEKQHFQVLALSTFAGFILLLLIALLLKESFPSPTSMLSAVSAGFTGSIGLASLYKGVSLGRTAMVTSTAGCHWHRHRLLGLLVQGLRSVTRFIGFAFAFRVSGWFHVPRTIHTRYPAGFYPGMGRRDSIWPVFYFDHPGRSRKSRYPPGYFPRYGVSCILCCSNSNGCRASLYRLPFRLVIGCIRCLRQLALFVGKTVWQPGCSGCAIVTLSHDHHSICQMVSKRKNHPQSMGGHPGVPASIGAIAVG